MRIASKFGARIIPFGAVGEDDLCQVRTTLLFVLVFCVQSVTLLSNGMIYIYISQMVLDYNDQMKIPFLKNLIEEITHDTIKLRYFFYIFDHFSRLYINNI